MDATRLAALQQSVRIGGKGTPRRKTFKLQKASNSADSKLLPALKKLGLQSLGQCDQVNMFLSGGAVMHFVMPQVSCSVASNTFCVQGHQETLSLTQVIQEYPDILRMLADANGHAQEDDDVPDLVEAFE